MVFPTDCSVAVSRNSDRSSLFIHRCWWVGASTVWGTWISKRARSCVLYSDRHRITHFRFLFRINAVHVTLDKLVLKKAPVCLFVCFLVVSHWLRTAEKEQQQLIERTADESTFKQYTEVTVVNLFKQPLPRCGVYECWRVF